MGAGRPPIRCRRCQKKLGADERELFHERSGLCYWCSYVDPQG